LVTAVVNVDGTIERQSVAVTQSVHPYLDAEAQRFVKDATLWPACRNGQPARVRILVPVVFEARRQFITPQQGFMVGLVVGLGGLIGALLAK
jgi:TonB family protein